jgi:hypothetical protein
MTAEASPTPYQLLPTCEPDGSVLDLMGHGPNALIFIGRALVFPDAWMVTSIQNQMIDETIVPVAWDLVPGWLRQHGAPLPRIKEWRETLCGGDALPMWLKLRRAAKEKATRQRRVYFIRAGANGPIKIGSANNVARRMNGLQTASPYPLRLLASIVGSTEDEFGLHKRFAADRLHGEWFTPSPDLLAYIESVST